MAQCWFEGVRIEGKVIICSGEVVPAGYREKPERKVLDICRGHLDYLKSEFSEHLKEG